MTDPPEVAPIPEGPARPPLDPPVDQPVDPRAIRLTTGPATRADDDPTLIVGPDDERLAGTRLDRAGPGRAVLVEASGQQTRLLARAGTGERVRSRRPGGRGRRLADRGQL